MQGAKMESIDKEGRSVLLLAAARAAWKSVLVLIRLGADLKHKDSCSRNILHHIVISGGNLDKFTSSLEKVSSDYSVMFYPYNIFEGCHTVVDEPKGYVWMLSNALR